MLLCAIADAQSTMWPMMNYTTGSSRHSTRHSMSTRSTFLRMEATATVAMVRSFVVAWFLFQTCLVFGQNRWHVEQYTAANGLPQNSVRSMAFDTSGYLWLTSEGGLVRFDGLRFKVFSTSTDSSIVEDRMAHVFRSATNELLVMDVLSSLYRIEENGPRRLVDGRSFSRQPHKIAGVLPSVGSFRAIVGDVLSDTALASWVRWEDQLLSVDGLEWAVLGPGALHIYQGVRPVKKVAVEAAHHMDFMLGGSIHVLDRHAMLHRSDRATHTLSPVAMVGGPDPSAIQRFFWNPVQEAVYALSPDTLWELQARSPDLIAFVPLITGLPKGTSVLAVSVSPEGDNVFVGTGNKGLFRYHRMDLRTNVRAEGGDDERGDAFYALVPLDSARVLTQDGWEADAEGFRRGSLLPSTTEGIAMHLDPQDRIWTSRSDTVWIIERSSGLILRELVTPSGLVTAYLQEGDTTWVAGIAGVVAFVHDVPVVVYNRTAADFHEQVFALRRAPNGSLWLATGKGVFSVDASTGTISPVPGLQEIFVRALHREGDRMFVGTYGQGAFAAMGERIVPFPLDPRRDLSHVHAFVRDLNGWLWLPTNRGLFRAEGRAVERYLQDTTALFQYAFHGPRSGVSTLEFNGGCSPTHAHLANGHLVLPTIDGLVWFHPDHVDDPWPRGRVRVDALRVNGIAVDRSEQLAPLDTDAAIDVEVSIPFWGDVRNLQLQYRFAGLEQQPLPVPDNGHIQAVRLPAGRYTLQVMLPGADGDIQDLLHFGVLAPWYMRWWSITLAAVLLVLIGLLLNRQRFARVLRRKEELERILSERADRARNGGVLLREEGEEPDRSAVR